MFAFTLHSSAPLGLRPESVARPAMLSLCMLLLSSGCSHPPPPGAERDAGADGGAQLSLDTILAELRSDLEGTLLKYANDPGWPVALHDGHLFVSADSNLEMFAGDHDGWTGTPLTADQGFRWRVLPVAAGDRYKFTNGTDYFADPWSRSYHYDDFGEISLVAPTGPHLERYFQVAGAAQARTIRVWVPESPPSRVLYVHDGQNLFDPQAFWGGWHLQSSIPDAMLVVGLDNTTARMDEYTHVQDIISGTVMGGLGDAYADYLQNTVRPLIRARYGEVGPIGTMGSSLGGLISFHIADRHPDEYAFAASLSGTMGWGRIAAANETMIERYQSRGHRTLVLYLDSGGEGTCYDSDNDTILDDDPNATDNYCENAQMRDVLESVGYTMDADLFYVWEPGAVHNEAAWAARVWQPLQIFSGL